MCALRLSVAVAAMLLITPLLAVAADPPGPPQPPLTNATVLEWRQQVAAIQQQVDNAFLYEEAIGQFAGQVAAWKDASVFINLQIERVTKEGVHCNLPYFPGRIIVRDEDAPPISARDRTTGAITLKIDDVVPLEVARRLRADDVVVVQGVIMAGAFQIETGITIDVGKAQAIAVVTKSYLGQTRGMRLSEYVQTPHYPLDALTARVDGSSVVQVSREDVSLVTSAGSVRLDEAAIMAVRNLRPNWHLFPGEHRISFTILGDRR